MGWLIFFVLAVSLLALFMYAGHKKESREKELKERPDPWLHAGWGETAIDVLVPPAAFFLAANAILRLNLGTWDPWLRGWSIVVVVAYFVGALPRQVELEETRADLRNKTDLWLRTVQAYRKLARRHGDQHADVGYDMNNEDD